MFDYSHVTPRDFEMLAKEYLESTYQGSSWTLTKASGDGNRDVVCTYRFLDQEFEYWAEAKFSKAINPEKLKKVSSIRHLYPHYCALNWSLSSLSAII